MVERNASVFSEFDVGAGPNQQSCAQCPLQPLHLTADGGLGQVQSRGGDGELPGFCDGDEGGQQRRADVLWAAHGVTTRQGLPYLTGHAAGIGWAPSKGLAGASSSCDGGHVSVLSASTAESASDDDLWHAMALHRPVLMRVALAGGVCRQDAEDCVHEAMLKAATFKDLDRDRLLPFLVTVVKRVVVDHHRTTERRLRLTGTAPADVEQSHEHVVCDAAEAAWLGRQLPLLTPREREVLTHRLQGASTRQIADRYSLSPKTVETLLARARRRLEAAWRSTLGLAWPGGCWRWLRRGGVVAATVPVVTGIIMMLPSTPDADGHRPPAVRSAVDEPRPLDADVVVPSTVVAPTDGERTRGPRTARPLPTPDLAGPEQPSARRTRPPVLVRGTTPPIGDPSLVEVGEAEVVLEQEPVLDALERCLDGLDLDGNEIGC